MEEQNDSSGLPLRRGLVTMCAARGMAPAIIIERVQRPLTVMTAHTLQSVHP